MTYQPTKNQERNFVSRYREIHGKLHEREFDLAVLMSEVLTLFERAHKGTAKGNFCAYVGVTFNVRSRNALNLSGGTRRKYYNMAIEARRFKRRFKQYAAKRWNDIGGWDTITILNGLSGQTRDRATALLLDEVKARGIGITVATARRLLEQSGIRPRKPGRPRHADAAINDAKVKVAIVAMVRELQKAGLATRAKRSKKGQKLLETDARKLVNKILAA